MLRNITHSEGRSGSGVPSAAAVEAYDMLNEVAKAASVAWHGGLFAASRNVSVGVMPIGGNMPIISVGRHRRGRPKARRSCRYAIICRGEAGRRRKCASRVRAVNPSVKGAPCRKARARRGASSATECAVVTKRFREQAGPKAQISHGVSHHLKLISRAKPRRRAEMGKFAVRKSKKQA